MPTFWPCKAGDKGATARTAAKRPARNFEIDCAFMVVLLGGRLIHRLHLQMRNGPAEGAATFIIIFCCCRKKARLPNGRRASTNREFCKVQTGESLSVLFPTGLVPRLRAGFSQRRPVPGLLPSTWRNESHGFFPRL